jgi:hypothetical protein
MKDTSQEME